MEGETSRGFNPFRLHNLTRIFFFLWQGGEEHHCLYGGSVMSGERGGCLVDWEVEEGKPSLSKREQIKGLLLVP